MLHLQFKLTLELININANEPRQSAIAIDTGIV